MVGRFLPHSKLSQSIRAIVILQGGFRDPGNGQRSHDTVDLCILGRIYQPIADGVSLETLFNASWFKEDDPGYRVAALEGFIGGDSL